MTNEEREVFIRNVITTAASIDDAVKMIVQRWDNDDSETWNAAVEEGRAND